MGSIILFVCLGSALNLALWAAFLRKLDALPSRIASLVHRERNQAAAQALAVLQEAAAAKVGPLVSGLRTYHDQIEQSLRGQLAEAETRARVAERRAAEAVPLLGAASGLAQEMRRTLEEARATMDGVGELLATVARLRDAIGEAALARAPATPVPGSGARATGEGAARVTVPAGPDSDDGRPTMETAPPTSCAPPAPTPGEEDSDDERTVVGTRPAIRPPPRLDEPGSREGRIGAPSDQPGGRAS